MYLTAEIKQKTFKKYGKTATNTGSSEGQIAVLTTRINHLTEHLQKSPKDHNTERSLVIMVGQRKRLLNYLKDTEIGRYRTILKELKIRK